MEGDVGMGRKDAEELPPRFGGPWGGVDDHFGGDVKGEEREKEKDPSSKERW